MIAIKPYAEHHVDAVRRFNERLQAGGETSQFPASPVPGWLPKAAGRNIFQEYYLAVDGDDAVRGCYILKHQDFWIKHRVLQIADYQLPISEGIVDRRFSLIGPMLLRDALRRQPILFGLGIGGYDEAVSRLFLAAGWSMFPVPFFFRVVRPARFLRNIAFLRRSAARRFAFDLSAATGLGWLAVRAYQAFHGRMESTAPSARVEQVDEFADWADEVWNSCKRQYGMTAVRDAETLHILYPQDNARFIRLKVSEGPRPTGWAVLLDTQLSGHKHFGNMRLGSVVDCFASVEDAPTVVAAARRCLESRGVDLIVSNQSHVAWCRGFEQAGFLAGPSNYLLTASKGLADLLHDEGVSNDELHFNRGDGDGPIHL